MESHNSRRRWSAWTMCIALVALGSIVIFLLIGHRPSTFGWLIYVIALACPLMHLFMHRGHRHSTSETQNEHRDELTKYPDSSKKCH